MKNKFKNIKEPILESVYWDGELEDFYGNKRPVIIFKNLEWETLKTQIELCPIRFLFFNDDLFTWEASKATHDMVIFNLFGKENLSKIFKGVFLNNLVRINKEGNIESYLNRINDLSNYLYDGDFEVEWNNGL